MRTQDSIQIKICGITREQEIDWLLEEQVEYLGMVLFCPQSKRNLEPERAAELLVYLKEQEKILGRVIQTVAVMVSPTREQMKLAEELGFDFLQLHGRIEPELWKQVKLPVIRAVQVVTNEQMTETVNTDNCVVARLYDAARPGSGKAFDWKWLAEIALPLEIKLFLAGGLTPDNVAEAIRMVHPDVVDVSRGVEADSTADGSFAGKDREKISRFVKAVREQKELKEEKRR